MFFGILGVAIVIGIIFVAIKIIIAIFGSISTAIRNSNAAEEEKRKQEHEKQINSDLITAVKNGDKQAAQLAIENGAAINLVSDNATPLDIAKDEEIISLLKSHGAKTKAELDREADEAMLIADSYFYGKGKEQNYEKAVEYYTKAKNLGCDFANHNLSICYRNGLGVEKDVLKAFDLCSYLANKGEAVTQYLCGTFYLNGEARDCFGNPNYDMAAFEFGRAANQGMAEAQYVLGLLYYNAKLNNGYVSYKEAGEWWEKAAAQGHEEAKKQLQDLVSSGMYQLN